MSEFNGMKQNNDLVGKEEIIKFVRSHGFNLGLEDTKILLKEYFGIEEGVVVIKNFSKKTPSGAEKVHFKGENNPVYIYCVSSFKCKKDGSVAMVINNITDPDKWYSGDTCGDWGTSFGSGVFHFFIDCDYEVLVPK
jgi:hypothetical protein